MLPWQQNMLDQWDIYSVDHPAALRRKALALALSIYGVLFLLFFIPHLWHTRPTTVFIKGASAPVLFVAKGSSQRKGSLTKRSQRVKKAAPPTPAPMPKKEVQKPALKAKEPKKVDPKKAELPTRTTVVKEQKSKQKSKKEIQLELKKAQAAAQAKKLEEAKKAEAEKKAKARKEAEEKKAKKVAEKSLNKPAEKPQEKIIEKSEKIENIAQEKKVENSEIDDAMGHEGPEEIVIGQEDISTLKSHMALNAAIMRVWSPPNIKVTSPAQIVVEIDAQGVVKNAELEKKSGILVYDIEARAAALRAEFPKEYWGKSIIFVFGA